MLDLSANPAKILGTGLSANVVGVLIGGVLGNFFTVSGVPDQNTVAIALAVICVTLVILPPLYRYLSVLLDDHAFYAALSVMPPAKQDQLTVRLARSGNLSAREREVAVLLLQGKTYRKIAGELYISENTVKTHVKNIYSKFNIQSRGELIDLAVKEDSSNL
jgi:DNA-binding CsgD family transcriptional regulator